MTREVFKQFTLGLFVGLIAMAVLGAHDWYATRPLIINLHPIIVSTDQTFVLSGFAAGYDGTYACTSDTALFQQPITTITTTGCAACVLPNFGAKRNLEGK